MNIMLVSVTERTREIGIRLAIGAFERDVLTQFLIEAVVLSLFGGTIGISIALGASYAAARALSLPFALDYSIVAMAFMFSAAVGIVFGFFRHGERRVSTRSKPFDMSDPTRSNSRSPRRLYTLLTIVTVIATARPAAFDVPMRRRFRPRRQRGRRRCPTR
jgi:hypothetical protein